MPADLVVLGIGVVPNTELAGAAGIELGARNAIRVDRRQRTSADGVWAAGDCCESFHLVSQRPVHLPLGTVANRQARVAGMNIGGGYATFPGVVGTAITKICSTEIARTGLSEREATAAGFGFESVTIESTDPSRLLPRRRSRSTVKMLGRAPDGAAARRPDRGGCGRRQAHRRGGHRAHRRPDRRRGDGPRPVVRTAVLAGLGPGGGRRPATHRGGI